MVTLDDILQVSLGLSFCGMTAALAFKLLTIMTRYNVLLTGQSLDELDPATAPDSTNRSAPPFRYRLRIQSLEPTRTEHPLQVTIRGFPEGNAAPSPDHHVWVAAGWKSIHVVRNFASPRPGSQGVPEQSTDASEPFLWQANFPDLPALDTWSFDVVMPCHRLEFSIRFVGVEESKLLAPTFRALLRA